MKLKLWMACGALAAQAASAGVYVEMVDHDIKSNKTELAQKIYVQNGNGRFVDAEGHATLIKNGTFYIIDDKDKSYVMFDKATMEQLAKKISEAMEKMKEQLAQLPPEQRAQMEQMMPGLSGGDKKWTVEVIDTGKSDKVDGRNCRIWDVKRDGKLERPDLRGGVFGSSRQGKLPGDVREFREGVRGNGEIRPHDGGHDDQRVQCAVESERLPGPLPWLRRGQARR